MRATVTFTKDIEGIPTSCNVCPFVDACDRVIHGITKRGGMEFTAMAMRRRHKACPMTVDDGLDEGPER